MSKKRSKKTRSKWREIYSAQEGIEDAEDVERLKSSILTAQSTLDEVGSEYEEVAEKFGYASDNQERFEHCEYLRNELDGFLEECDEQVDCPNCDGGTYLCDACDGDGQFDCDECAGDGRVPCNECLGRGCDECDEGEINCEKCGGDGSVYCKECGGDGQIECDTCSGLGSMELHEAPQDVQADKFEEIKLGALELDWDSPV